jgi:hypothetical protein
VLIDCAKKSVKLTTPDGKELECVTEPVVTAKGIANRVMVKQLGASKGYVVSVVNVFPDDFPEELPGIPLDWDIEFVVNLIPGTAAIYKSPYRMATPDLAKLKECINELLEKVFIHASSSLWGASAIFVPKKDGTKRLCAKLSKCEFWLKQVAFLDHIISKGFISMDPRKIHDVLNWNAPTSVGDIWSFLGLAGYYRMLIEGFSKITKPMTELLEKDKKFMWMPACEASFQELKKRLTTTSV